MTIATTLDLARLDALVLKSGAHAARLARTDDPSDAKLCAMEAVAWLAGEPHTDHPACACPVISAFVRNLNDRIRDDAERTELLRPVLPILLNTKASRAVEMRRAYLAVDWAVRTNLPGWLDMVDSLKAHAGALRGLPAITDQATAKAAQEACQRARSDADADADAAAYASAAASADAASAAASADAASADAAAAASADAASADASAAASAAAASAAASAAAASAAAKKGLSSAEARSAVQLIRDMAAISTAA